MNEPVSVTREIVKRLALHLRAQMPELAEVLEDWPEDNYAIRYPSISIFTKGPVHRPFSATQLSQLDSDDGKKVLVLSDIGDYEWRLQLDMWCGNKPERHALYERFYQAFNSQFIEDSKEMAGISLPLVDYHNTMARYDLLSYDFDTDNEAATQRKEWRAKMVVIAHCRAVVCREFYKVKTTEIHSDIRTDIKVEVDSDFDPDIITVTE